MTFVNNAKEHAKRNVIFYLEKGEVTKWNRVNVDLWSPKTVKDKNSWNYQAQLYGTPTASCCQQIFDTTWLACYP